MQLLARNCFKSTARVCAIRQFAVMFSTNSATTASQTLASSDARKPVKRKIALAVGFLGTNYCGSTKFCAGPEPHDAKNKSTCLCCCVVCLLSRHTNHTQHHTLTQTNERTNTTAIEGQIETALFSCGYILPLNYGYLSKIGLFCLFVALLALLVLLLVFVWFVVSLCVCVPLSCCCSSLSLSNNNFIENNIADACTYTRE